MRKIVTFLSFFIFQTIFADAQQIIFHHQVNDQEQASGFVVEKVWLQHYARPIIKISGAVYEPVTAIPEGVTAGSATPEVEIMMGKERKRPFAFVRVPVYSLSASQNPQRLSSFSIEIVEAAATPSSQPRAKTTATSSVLATGNWHKIAVAGLGMYKIDYNFLQSELGIDPSTINPANIRVYGNGGVVLSESNAVYRPDDLVENAIVVSDGGDNAFNPGDYILFYANGPQGWAKDNAQKTFYHIKNIYEDKSYYFLNFDIGPGQRLSSVASLPPSAINVTHYDDLIVHDDDLVNISRIGKKWWGEEFSSDPGKQITRSFSFNTGNTVDSATIRIQVGSRSAASNGSFSIAVNGQTAGSLLFGSNSSDYPMLSKDFTTKLPLSGQSTDIQITYNPATSTAKGNLNYIELITRRQLSFSGGTMTFRDWNSVGQGNSATFKIQNAPGNLTVWDITDPLQPFRVNGTLSGNEYSFTADASVLHEYVAFDGSNYLTPEFIKKVDNQNLHGQAPIDYLIVSHPDFLSAATKLADFHRQKNNYRVLVVTPEQVYNEFSSGSQDIAAIRDFARMFYERAGMDTAQMPKFLLLFGDASYDYKNRIPNNQNFVPTYETSESEYVIEGYCSDDFFGFLDDNEDIETWNIANTLDLGVGRIPATSAKSAEDIVNKIIRYASPASLGPWRVSTTLLADNGDSNIHMEDAEIMAGTINSHSNLYNETKVYLSGIPTVSTPGGERAPDANKTINDQVFKGTFLINYNGHGSITTLAHERILTQDDFNNWKNQDKLPIMVTATCDFSKFDDPSYSSAAELLMMKSTGGAIALLTTTQLVYQHHNRPMNVDFLNALFQKYNGIWPTLGDAFRYSKNNTYASTNNIEFTLANYRKFVLLGDPALTPAFPRHEIRTESIEDGYTSLPVDTMKALGKYKISGSVRDVSGNVLSDFNGRVYVTIYDKPRVLKTITGPSREYAVQNNVIYKGKATVTNGKFSFLFITPKDLNYDFGQGKISYYAENGTTDAAGSDTSLKVGGFSDVVIDDVDGPVVKPFIGDSLFKDGGITGPSTLLYVQLFDEIGINVSGNSIGHDLMGVLDGDIQHPFILNDYYETAPNDYTRGYVYFPLTGLSDGRHTIRVKAWDMNNNSGEGQVNFEVVNGNVVKVNNLMNYPNPFTDQTRFVFEHNHPDENLRAQILIYNTAGSLVRTIDQTFMASGSRSIEMTWDGTSNNGAKLPSGIYVYRINISTDKGIQATAYQKLVLIR